MTQLRRSSALLLGLSVVFALGAMGCSGDDEGPAGPSVDTVAPAVPSGVTAAVITDADTTVRISWDANESDADLAGYCVYRSHAPEGPYLPVEEGMLVQTNAWVDSAVLVGGSYYYRVAARDAAANESALSSATGVTIQTGSSDGPPRVSD